MHRFVMMRRLDMPNVPTRIISIFIAVSVKLGIAGTWSALRADKER